MQDTSSNKYAAWVALGLMYMWGAVFFAWIDFWNSGQTWMRVLAFFGAALVSLSGIAIALYTSNLERN